MTYKKSKIPSALRQAVWIKHNGEVFKAKCYVDWCQTPVTVFNFQCGHDKPEVLGGKTVLENLYPICAQCNTSMGSKYTIHEFSNINYKYTKATEQKTVTTKASTSKTTKPESKWYMKWLCFA